MCTNVSLQFGGELDGRRWKTQPEGARGCNRLELRKTRLTQQSSAMLIMLGGEAGRMAPIEHENGGRKETTAKKENKLKVKHKKKVEGKSILQAESMLIRKRRLAIRERFLKIRRELSCAGRMLE